MKLTFFTFLILSSFCFVSCRKTQSDPDIKQYDQQQIQSYIAANGITGAQRDTTNGDTTGIYYQIINPGKGAKVDYPDSVFFVYTSKSFDGKYSIADTALTHFEGLLGHVNFVATLPQGLMLSIRNNLKYKGGKMRVLVPSHLAFGKNGLSRTLTAIGVPIGGNQCMDFVVNLVDDPIAYDDLVIKNYMAANNLTGYSKTATGLYYKIITPGTGQVISDNSSLTMNYSIYLMNNTHPDNDFYASTNTFTYGDIGGGGIVAGFAQGLKLIKGGGAISVIVPSRLAYGAGGSSGIPAGGCLRWDISNVVVTNY